MAKSFGELALADGQIVTVSMQNADLRVELTMWNEETETLLFRDFLGVEGLNPVNEDLSHGVESTGDPFLIRCCALREERPNEFRCFCFYSAWSDVATFKVIARSFELIGRLWGDNV